MRWFTFAPRVGSVIHIRYYFEMWCCLAWAGLITIKNMRQITRDIVSSFMARVSSTKGNSHTDGATLYLHGNAIARHGARGLEITNAGWQSNTTKERLNGLAGVSINQKAGVWYLNGKEWDGEWVTLADWQ